MTRVITAPIRPGRPVRPGITPVPRRSPPVVPRVFTTTSEDAPVPLRKKVPVVVPPPRRQENIYTMLNNALLTFIARVRDVHIQGSFEQKAQMLADLDEIMPEWITAFRSVTLENFPELYSRLNPTQIFLFAASQGIPANAYYLEEYSTQQMCDVIAGLVLCPVISETPGSRQISKANTVVTTFKDLYSSIQQGIIPSIKDPRFLTRVFDLDINRNGFSDRLASILVEMASYPPPISADAYAVIRKFDSTVLTHILVRRGVQRDRIQFLSRDNLVFALTRGYLPPPDPRVNEYRERHVLLSSLQPEIIGLLIDLYGLHGDARGSASMNLIELAKVPERLPLEGAILNINRLPPVQIADSIGMVIPPFDGQGNNVAQLGYLIDNILDYKRVVSRKANCPPLSRDNVLRMKYNALRYLEEYTDEEIMSSLGIYVWYASRRGLLTRVIDLIEHPGFFISLITPQHPRRLCRNSETVMMTDIQDPTAFIICYGTLTSHYGYEVQELMNSFHFKSDDGINDFVFLHPENIRIMFSDAQMEDLRELLDRFKTTPGEDCLGLIAKIKNGLKERRSKTGYDRDIIRRLIAMPAEQKDILRIFLYHIFYTGMYMRRWQGPGKPYPIRRAETEKKVSPDDSTLRSLEECQRVLNTMSRDMQQLAKMLRIVEYFNDTPEQYSSSGLMVGVYMDTVIMGRECIRMASSRFVGTGYYYLKTLYNEVIADVAIEHLDHIT